MTNLTPEAWNELVSRHPQTHLLQTAQWGELKAQFGWRPVRLRVGNVGAQVLFKQLPFGFSLAYIPKGPVGEDWTALWPVVDQLCRDEQAVFLKVEPDAWEEDPIKDILQAAGFKQSAHNIQPRQTITIDLTRDEDKILAAMKQKTRYNIRLAGRKGVEIAISGDVDLFSRLMDVTGERDTFGVHSLAYYQRAYEIFHPKGKCELLIASYQDQPLAGVMVFKQGNRAWYLYGASNNLHRNLMPAYLVQWEAMRWAKQQGCTFYDLWGIPDAPEDVLEDKFMRRSDGLWGVYRFKRGFGGQLRRSLGAWDKVYKPAIYLPYQLMMARRTGGE